MMVVMAAILIASPVLAIGSSQPIEAAKEGPKKQPTSISLTGKIVDKNGSGTEIDVAIRMTNKAFIQYRGKTMPVDISSALCLEWLKAKKSKAISCSSLAVGDKVSIIARVDPQTKDFTARRVQRKQPRIR